MLLPVPGVPVTRMLGIFLGRCSSWIIVETIDNRRNIMIKSVPVRTNSSPVGPAPDLLISVPLQVQQLVDPGGDLGNADLVSAVDLVLLDLYLLVHEDLPLHLALLLQQLVVEDPPLLQLPLVYLVVLLQERYLFR